MQFAHDAIKGVAIDNDAFEAAILAATEADRAGYEPGDVVEYAIQAYILGIVTKGRTATIPGPPAPVFNPSEGWIENYAEWHEKYAVRWTEAFV